MKTKSILFLFITLSLTVLSCKKSTVERRMSSGSGEWNIDKFTVTEGNFFAGSGVTNAGTMKFSKGGDLLWTETIGDTTAIYNCKWSNTKDEITIIRNGNAMKFKIDNGKRKEMQLVTVLDESSYSEPYGYYGFTALTLQISKK